MANGLHQFIRDLHRSMGKAARLREGHPKVRFIFQRDGESSFPRMDPDMMVGQLQVERLDSHAGHMALDTPLRRTDRTGARMASRAGGRGRAGHFLASRHAGRGVAGEAFGLVKSRAGGAGALMGIVARNAAKSAAAFGITAAARPADSLRADPAGFSGWSSWNSFCRIWQSLHCLLVTASGEAPAGLTIAGSGKPACEGGDMVPSGAVAAPAADGAIGGLGADGIMAGARVGHMAIKALRQAVTHADRFP